MKKCGVKGGERKNDKERKKKEKRKKIMNEIINKKSFKKFYGFSKDPMRILTKKTNKKKISY